MSIANRLAACAAFACLAAGSVTVLADDHAYSEGPVVNVSRIRTVDGRGEDYLNWVATTWKREQEIGKKAGYIVSYAVYTVEPRTLEDADLLLVVTYKNWAALDGALAKGDAVAKEISGSLAAASQAQVDRAKIRTVLGSTTMQELILK
jgi:hypothetical protein